MQQLLTVKNKSLKMSPSGIITLPVSARRCLGMKKATSELVYLQVKDKQILFSNSGKGAKVKVSPKGNITLVDEAKRVLDESKERHYWLEINDTSHSVVLHPF